MNFGWKMTHNDNLIKTYKKQPSSINQYVTVTSQDKKKVGCQCWADVGRVAKIYTNACEFATAIIFNSLGIK